MKSILDLLHGKWRLSFYSIPTDVSLRELIFWWNQRESCLGISCSTSKPLPDLFLYRHSLPDYVLPLTNVRSEYHDKERTITIKWVCMHIGILSPTNMLLYRHHFLVLCDGSGGDKWGTGVCIPKQKVRTWIGGDKLSSVALLGRQGRFDSAVVEVLALAYAIDVARLRYEHGFADRFLGVTILVDNTNPYTSFCRGFELTPELLRAIHHVQGCASKLLAIGWSIRVVHKKVYGYSKHWQPHGCATNGRELNLAWGDPAPERNQVYFADLTYGHFSDRDANNSVLVHFCLSTTTQSIPPSGPGLT